jgi:hypothetical protein
VEQKAELKCLSVLVKEPIATNDILQRVGAGGDLEDTDMEVDAPVLVHVIEDVTYRVLEPVNIPVGQRKASLMSSPNLT